MTAEPSTPTSAPLSVRSKLSGVANKGRILVAKSADAVFSLFSDPKKKIFLFGAGLFLGLGLVVAKLYVIQIKKGAEYKAKAVAQCQREQIEKPRRGEILDAEGRALAITADTTSCFLDPKAVENWDKVWETLSETFGLDENELQAKVDAAYSRNPGTRFLWIKRKISPEEVNALCKANVKGIGIQNEFERDYPMGNNMVNFLGFTNMDGRGMEGLELGMSSLLSGANGVKSYRVDALGRPLLRINQGSVDSLDGSNLTLTIDAVIQNIAFEALKKAVDQYHPVGAVVTILEAKTNRILAMVSLPTYDPNNKPGMSDPDCRRNRAVTDVFEPGSVMKPLVVADAIQRHAIAHNATAAWNGKPYSLQTEIDCENGHWRYIGRTITDIHGKGVLSLAEVIVNSLNIGAAKAGLDLGEKNLQQLLRDLHLGSKLNIQVPGEVSGIVTPARRWTYYSQTSVSFGHELAVTPLQLAAAFSVFANEGCYITPRLYDRIETGDGKKVEVNSEAPRRVYDAALIRDFLPVLGAVVERGTAKAACSKYYTIGGKTGTTTMIQNGHYVRDHDVASFVGVAPVGNPRITVQVSLFDPQSGGRHFGGTLAAPVCLEIVEKTLPYLGVMPDKNPEIKNP